MAYRVSAYYITKSLGTFMFMSCIAILAKNNFLRVLNSLKWISVMIKLRVVY